jgi:hypothetical protein
MFNGHRCAVGLEEQLLIFIPSKVPKVDHNLLDISKNILNGSNTKR